MSHVSMCEIPDEALMQRYVSGDCDAFDELFRRYEPRVYSFFLKRSGSRERAEDLYQELFLRIHRGRESYDPRRSFAPWLYKIAHRLLVDDHRRAYRTHEIAIGDPQPVGRWAHQADEAASRQLLARVLAMLSPEERYVLIAAKLEGVAYAQLAEPAWEVCRGRQEVGVARDAARARSSRARCLPESLAANLAHSALGNPMVDEQTPSELRAGVRAGILAAVERDAELRGGRTARLLAAAGALGVLGAVGITLMISGHPFGHHPPWHVVVVTATWSGLLVVSLALIFLGVRTPSLPLARAACTGIVGARDRGDLRRRLSRPALPRMVGRDQLRGQVEG